ncbi:metal-binding protein [Bradyrhizobium sp. WBOS7]|uniref:Metal-binding protein n=2 Tax=Nitrobacteraceae TaxID=41294 RepID=A0AAE9N9T8_9BRAD|nr:metal-binding protein [Bradyrhizobium sp. WBOS2]MDD1571991.1 metal-binding protein [Bradyrhizobium sp. WBOS1]MDD1575495.1 metal-binding protein [Bradyrhizobium sp. WBOS7]MDD1600958.1 metal-binding protein [Bradyrhizobium sp. WBOS16]UUO36093.1 metal-binding protein [Bradyrhizobium sp. WBOS01]UUO42398.1 metal-binding protein [Bradyrhizobium sp. WBOS02]UUO56736.1 metal-binding protein [Bradyrhizobium sp. WBOS07]UUO66731.1 metal-binding protein [Bradyrhizobium betae]
MRERGHVMTRRSLAGLMAAAVAAVAAVLVRPAVAAQAQDATITVHRDPSCGCCAGWVQHLRDAGFVVQVEETADLDVVRNRLGIPSDLAACHTAEVAGYLIEGHVPAAAVRRLLSERPIAKGLAVPGMPVGSPGMEGGKPEPYTVVLFGADGQRPFMRFVGSQVIG